MGTVARALEGLAFFTVSAVLAGVASAQVGTLTTVSGRVIDMSRDASGDLLFCTEEGDVGRIDSGGTVTVLADSASGPFPCDLIAISPTPAGDIAILDACSDIYVLPAAGPPAALVYSDLYIINDPTDLIVDASGNFVTTAQTATSGVRALQWVRPDGSAWAYYTIDRTPVAVAADALGGDLIFADTGNGGALRRVETSDDAHPVLPLETFEKPGYSLGAQDGDLAVETNGDVLSIAAGSLLHFDRIGGGTTTLASGLGNLRGLAIGASSGAIPSASGWSAYLAQGAGPNTNIREVGNVGAPAAVLAAALGTVPNRGTELMFFGGLHAFDLEVDLNGDLLICGDQWGSNFEVRRIALPSLAVSVVADMNDGLPGRIEAVSVSTDGAIWAMSSGGSLTRIEEGGAPLLTTFYSDPGNLIGTAKDICLDRDGTVFVGNYFSWSNGSVVEIDPNGFGSTLLSTEETRGITPDPFTTDLILTEWNDSGFNGDVDLYDPDGGGLTSFPGFDELNLTNAAAWGDGKTCQDVEGNLYVASEDDFSLLRYDRTTGKKVRIGSGYINHPTGVAIARSSGSVASTTGWSLYAAEWNYLWEIPSVPPPAPRLRDGAAPAIGRTVGWLAPDAGTARALTLDPFSGELLVSTSLGRLEKIDRNTGATSTVAVSASPRDMTALATTSGGHVLAATLDGFIFDVDPSAGYATSLLHNLSSAGLRVRGMTVDGADRPILVHSPAASVGGELLRVDGALDSLAFLARGRRTAIDPLTAEYFVTEAGTGLDAGGEILRVDAASSPPRVGHVRHEVFASTPFGEFDGGIAFDDAGNFYFASGSAGRVWRHDRATAARSLVAGQYDHPLDLVLAPGTPGTAGAQGTSLFVLDGNTVYEVGVPGLPAPPPPSVPPGAAPPADLAVHGPLVPGALLELSIDRPADAGRVYWILPSLIGKEPGLPLALLGDPSDQRVIPSNFSDLWTLSTDAFVMPGFVGVLDGAGQTPPATGIQVPNDPVLLQQDVFLEFTWIAIDGAEQNGVATVGGTAQVFLGD